MAGSAEATVTGVKDAESFYISSGMKRPHSAESPAEGGDSGSIKDPGRIMTVWALPLRWILTI